MAISRKKPERPAQHRTAKWVLPSAESEKQDSMARQRYVMAMALASVPIVVRGDHAELLAESDARLRRRQ